MKSDRKEKVREVLVSKPFTALSELEAMFPEVSSMTLRRDIDFFEREGDVLKVRGGARSKRFINLSEEANYYQRATINMEAKRRIAKEAASLVTQNQVLFFDSGSTISQMGMFLPKEPLQIYTSDPGIALALIQKENLRVGLLGGILSHANLSVSGLDAQNCLSDKQFDWAFLSPSGFSLEEGFSCGDAEEAKVKALAVSKAKKVVLLLDSHKLEHSLSHSFCKLYQVDVLISDAPLPKAYQNACALTGVQLVVTN